LAAYAGLRPFTVITGGSEGIGRALAGEFARGGHNILLVARRPGPLALAAAELAPTNVKIVTLSADLATAAGCAAIETALLAANAYCDVLVNNAAIGLGGPFAGQPPADLTTLVSLNVGALTSLTRQFLPGMLSRGQGGILNVSSLGGYIPGPRQAAYYASKAYVTSLSEALAQETAGQGVRISALVPGPVATKYHARVGTEHAYYLGLLGVASPELVARLAYRGFRSGRIVIYPGILQLANAIVLRILPHWLSVPAINWMLKPR